MCTVIRFEGPTAVDADGAAGGPANLGVVPDTETLDEVPKESTGYDLVGLYAATTLAAAYLDP